MGRIGRKIGRALGGIAGSELAKTKVGRKLIGMGIGNKKVATSLGQKGGERLGDILPFANGGKVVVIRAPRKRRSRK